MPPHRRVYCTLLYMKLVLLTISCFLFSVTFAQYKIDSSIKTSYIELFQKLPDQIKADKDTEFKNGLGILISIETDTLNKNELQPVDTSLKIFNINSKTGKEEELKKSPSEDEILVKKSPNGFLVVVDLKVIH